LKEEEEEEEDDDDDDDDEQTRGKAKLSLCLFKTYRGVGV
jgi:hypothetical protein